LKSVDLPALGGPRIETTKSSEEEKKRKEKNGKRSNKERIGSMEAIGDATKELEPIGIRNPTPKSALRLLPNMSLSHSTRA
jgi:hypothetical protein